MLKFVFGVLDVFIGLAVACCGVILAQRSYVDGNSAVAWFFAAVSWTGAVTLTSGFADIAAFWKARA